MKPEVTVYVKRRLLCDERAEYHVSSRMSLAEIVETFAPDLPLDLLQVSVDDGPPIPFLWPWLEPLVDGVAQEDWPLDQLFSPWDAIRPKPGRKVLIRLRAPKGAQGGGGQLGYTLGIFALAAVATYFGGPVAGAGVLALGAVSQAFLFAPSESDSGGTQRAFSITGSENQIAEIGQVIPYVSGEVGNIFPLHVSQPYTTVEHGQQYIHLLMSPGLGPVHITELKVGDIAFADFPDLEYEVREGFSGEAPTTLYPLAVVDPVLSEPILVTHAAGPVTVQMDDPDVTRLTFELTWYDGLYRYTGSGDHHSYSVHPKIEWRELPSGPWQTLSDVAINQEQMTVFRRSWSVDVAANPGGHEGRVTRTSSDDSDSDTRHHNVFYWTSFQGRSGARPVLKDGMALIALKVKAGPNAQGVIKRVTCTCKRYVLDYTGGDWVQQATHNPAAAFRDILQHPAANAGEIFPDSQIDLTELQDWRDRCVARHWRFGHVFADESSLMERLRTIAGSGRAGFSIVDGKVSVVQDRPLTDVVQAVTPHNSADFRLERTYRRLPDAIRVRFIDQDADWSQNEMVVYNDGFDEANALTFDDLDLTGAGIHLPQQAWEEGRYRLAEQYQRRWVSTVSMDLESITARRGEKVHFGQPAVLYGLATGRLLATSTLNEFTTGVTLEGPVLMEAGHSYELRIRSVSASGGNTASVVPLVTVVGTHSVLTFALPKLLSDANIQVGDLYIYGETGVDCVIKAIRPTGPRTALVELVAHAQPAIDNATTGLIGPYQAQPGEPAGRPKPPPAPHVVMIRRDDIVPPREPLGIRLIKLTAMLTAPPAKKTAADYYEVAARVVGTSDWSSPAVAPATGLEVPFTLPFGFDYQIRVRAVATSNGTALTSGWSNVVTVDAHTTGTTVIDIAGVTGLELVGQGHDTDFTGRDAHLVWRMTSTSGAAEIGTEANDGDTTFRDPTFSHWQVGVYSGASDFEQRREETVTQPHYDYTFERNYADAKRLAPSDPTSKVAREFTIQIWVVDTFGRRSATPARITVQNPAPALPLGASISVNFGTIWVSFNQPSDPDWVGMKVWAALSSGFVPNDATNLLGKSNVCIASFNEFQATGAPVLQGTDYYVRFAAYDAFGDAPALLNISSEFSVHTASIDLANIPAYAFDPPPIYTVSGNHLTWSSSTVHVTHPASSTTVTYAISSGGVFWTGQTLYISYQDQATHLESSTDPAHHAATDRTLMAVWRGGQEVAAFNGQAGIDGNFLYAGTITAAAIATGVAVITEAAQIASAIIGNAHITDLDVDKLIAGGILTKSIDIGAGSGGHIQIDGANNYIRVFDNQSPSIRRMQIGKHGAAADDYGMIIWDAGANVVFDADGVDGTFIHDLTVDTIKIKNGALGSKSQAFGTGAVNTSNGEDVISAAITGVSGGPPVLIWFTCDKSENYPAGQEPGGQWSLQLQRNGVVIATTTRGFPSGDSTPYGVGWLVNDNPVTGLNTYVVHINGWTQSYAQTRQLLVEQKLK